MKSLENKSFWSSDQFMPAMTYAFDLHRNDPRKVGDVPYFSHLMSVSSFTLQYGGNEEQAIAALLHDAAEDHGGESRLDDIRVRFGNAVADIVAVCSDCLVAEGAPKPDWRPRKEAYIQGLASASAAAKLVVCCDKIDNLGATIRDLEGNPGKEYWKPFKKGAEDQLWYYTSVVAALGLPDSSPHVADLGRKVNRFAELLEASCT